MAAHQALVPGILQERILEWVAISYSNAWKWKVKVKSLSHVQLLAIPWTAAYQAPPSMGFPGKSTGMGCHCLLRLFWWWWLNWYYLWTLLGSHFSLLDKSSCVHICHLLAILLKWRFWYRSWAGLRSCISNRIPDSANYAGEVEGWRGEGVGTTLSSKIVTDHRPQGTHTPCNILASLTGLHWADASHVISLFLPQCPISWPAYVLATNFEWTDYDFTTKDK